MRDPETGNSRGFGFISYDSFETSDGAIEVSFFFKDLMESSHWGFFNRKYFLVQAMNGQYLCNRQITVSYAYKKDTKGERHGTPAGMFDHQIVSWINEFTCYKGNQKYSPYGACMHGCWLTSEPANEPKYTIQIKKIIVTVIRCWYTTILYTESICIINHICPKKMQRDYLLLATLFRRIDLILCLQVGRQVFPILTGLRFLFHMEMVQFQSLGRFQQFVLHHKVEFFLLCTMVVFHKHGLDSHSNKARLSLLL